MNLLQRFSPGYILPSTASRGNLATIRERILQSLLLALLALSIPTAILGVRTELQVANLGLASFYIAICLLLFITTLSRNWPYTFRSLVIVTLIYILGVSQMFDTSLQGEFRFYLVVFSALTAVLLGLKAGIMSTAMGVLSILGLHLALSANPTLLKRYDLYLEGANWINGLLLYTLFSSGIVLSVSTLMNGLQRGLRENELLTSNLEKQRAILEETVQSRTQDIQRRLTQVRTAAEISRAISRLSDPITLFPQVCELVQERFGLYYAGIFLIEPSGRFAVLQAGTGEAGRAMIEQGHRLSIGGQSMIGWCIANRQPRIALDVGEEAVRFNNPHLPLTRSEVALPILSRTEVLGAMTFQSTEPRAFDQNDLIVLQGITDSLAVAIENANLFQELNQNLEEINALNRNYLQNAWSQTVSQMDDDFSFTYRGSDLHPSAPTGQVVTVPLLLRDQPIGEVTLELEDNQLSADDRAFIDSIATQTAIALENARLVRESEWRVFQESRLNEMSTELYRSTSLEGVLQSAVQQFGQLPGVAEVSIQLAPPEALITPGMENQGKEKLG